MLVVFHSKAASDVVMFAEHALMILRIVGRSYGDQLPERGEITQEQLVPAITAIEEAMHREKMRHGDAPGYSDEEAAEHPIAEPVSFRQRAWPLLSMLRASRDEGGDVTWEPASMW